jgi:hypothetical protein
VASVKDDPVLAEMTPRYTYLLALEDTSFEMFYRYMVLPASFGLKTNIGVVNTGENTGAIEAGHAARERLLAGDIDGNTMYIVKSPELLSAIQTALSNAPVRYYAFEEYVFIFPLE